jgi:hypothetical protein
LVISYYGAVVAPAKRKFVVRFYNGTDRSCKAADTPGARLVIAYETTLDDMAGPWPPVEADGWSIVRHYAGVTTWRRITLQTSHDLAQPIATTVRGSSSGGTRRREMQNDSRRHQRKQVREGDRQATPEA